jgi:hypothetical protein
MRKIVAISALTAALVACAPREAAADFTAFYGFNSTPSKRSAMGFSLGVGMMIVAFEFEYSRSLEDELDGAPSLTTGMFNGLIQTPTSSMQLYFTAGGGAYRERFREFQETAIATNIGGGMKLRLVGPVRLRVDYRIFSLKGDPLYHNPKRLYAGLNIAF